MTGVDPVVEVDRLQVHFPAGRGRRRDRAVVHAVDDVSFSIARDEMLALVGESGSGKSTMARAIVGLQAPTGGRVLLDGVDVAGMRRRELRGVRSRLGMVFQDPYASLDPSMRIDDSVAEPLRLHTRVSRRSAREQARLMLQSVGIHADLLARRPHALSGGQRQRVAIARSMILEPDLVVCDEAVSALDVSTRNQVLRLLVDLRERMGASYLFISHDLSVVRQIADRVAVMYLGQLVEIGPAARVLGAPAHPYTQALLSAVPVPDPRRQRARIVLRGEVASAAAPPAGCRFHTRCPLVMEVCRDEVPTTTPVHAGGTVACHLQTSGQRLAGASLPSLPMS